MQCNYQIVDFGGDTHNNIRQSKSAFLFQGKADLLVGPANKRDLGEKQRCFRCFFGGIMFKIKWVLMQTDL